MTFFYRKTDGRSEGATCINQDLRTAIEALIRLAFFGA
jgi:hypothetical protein